MIGIIDYGMGNLRSVQKAFEFVGAGTRVLESADQIARVDHLVLPGVGAFADGMKHLAERDLIDPIKAFIDTGRPFLGICIGMQLLLEGSEEDAPSTAALVPGLGALGGNVVKFSGSEYGPSKLKVPHMGWNAIRWKRDDLLFAGLEQGAFVYFVHSYYACPDDAQVISATTQYGCTFCSSVCWNNIWATQFHPEKSQRVGLKMLSNFAKL